MELLTVGYEGRTLPQLVRLLRGSGVTRLVDVRYRPQSRKAGFSPLPLFDALRKAGIMYESQHALGTPESIRTIWRKGEIAEGRARYRKLIRGDRRARVELLVAMARFDRVCLMC